MFSTHPIVDNIIITNIILIVDRIFRGEGLNRS